MNAGFDLKALSPEAQRAIFVDILRRDFASLASSAIATLLPQEPFPANWHHRALCHKLIETVRGKQRRLVVNMPPLPEIPIITLVAFPAFVLGHDPSKRIVVFAHSRDVVADLRKTFFAFVETLSFKAAFPRLRWKKTPELESVTTRDGGVSFLTVGESLPVIGADVIVIYEPLDPASAHSKMARERLRNFFIAKIAPYLNEQSRTSVIVVHSRLHVDDLSGFLLAQGGWEHFRLPAIAQYDEAIPLGLGCVHQRRRHDLLQGGQDWERHLGVQLRLHGKGRFQARYMQDPRDPTEYRFYDALQVDPFVLVRHQIWLVSDSVDGGLFDACCSTWGSDASIPGVSYTLHLLSDRLSYADLRAKVIELAREFQIEMVAIYDRGIGPKLCEDLTNSRPAGLDAPYLFDPALIEPRQSGPERRRSIVYVPKEASWLNIYLESLDPADVLELEQAHAVSGAD